MVLDRVLVLIQAERPEAVEADLAAETRGQGVHQEARGGSFDVNFVSQPVSGGKKWKKKKHKKLTWFGGIHPSREGKLFLLHSLPLATPASVDTNLVADSKVLHTED